ncbi:Ankyrin repeat-containing protein [Streptomyces sp. OV198]|jgi:HEAT repeat protein|uniref:ankyrin repeat domain-containing protein n=1 Tax=Streptomyces sp. OV198 TaxID=1882787 RepID=UPI000BCAE59D|nr:ankyrin repeat domain-containing protein [Streptomyces sp. OV198]SOE53531.1 Ankyrin repeat-containing protein [Streptomyces sp. OV198]
MGEDPLITAVRSGDEDAVRLLLEDGADPDAVDEQGSPALCLAISAFNSTIAGYLVEGGADPDRQLSDGTTPRLRAVDSGSIGLADCLLGAAAQLSEATRVELLARARQWHEMGPVAMLRERTSASDPVERVRIRDREWSADYHEIRLGGMTVRDGHTGILTLLEKHFGLHPGIAELAARACALEYPDWEHAAWWEITRTLAQRQDNETWEAATALRAHPDPLHRRFGAEVLISLNLGDPMSDAPSPFEQRTLEILLDWAAEEEHPDVLAETLSGLGQHEDPRIEPLGLSFLAHSAPQVRARVASTLRIVDSERSGRQTFTSEGLNALLALAQDTDASVRKVAAYRLAHSLNPEPAVGDILAGLLDDDDQQTRIWAVHGLAERDDPRCVDGAGRVGPVDEYEAWSWILGAPARYEQRQKEQDAPAARTDCESTIAAVGSAKRPSFSRTLSRSRS